MATITPSNEAPTDRADRAEREAIARESLRRDSLLIVGVEGMHSHGCEERVVQRLEATPGVREAEVDFASGQASVIFDARKTTAHQLLEVIVSAGFRCGEHFLGSGGGRVE